METQRAIPALAGTTLASEPCTGCEARRESVCNVVDIRDRMQLAAIAISRNIGKGHVFIEESDPATDFFNITAGTAKLYKRLPDGRQQIVGFAEAGDFLGLAVSTTYSFSAEAIEPLHACRFPRLKLMRLLRTLPQLEHRLLESACQELVMAQEQMLLLGRKTAQERVASFLMERSRAAAACGLPPGHIRLPMTRTEIGDYLGLTVETVSRTMSLFRTQRRIALLGGGVLALLDLPWLEAVATGLV